MRTTTTIAPHCFLVIPLLFASFFIHLQGRSESNPKEESHTRINDTTRSFWSNKPLIKPAVPPATNPLWAQNPIDAFIFKDLAANGLHPNPRASRTTLIRRAYYNLTGLAPSPEEVEAFIADDSPDAWSVLIEKLLESPNYGEKWARHWLDLVRYAESNGFERDSVKEHIWRYRDYIINAFNQDIPYDQFIMEQLAGDELEVVTRESLIATGFYRLMQWDDEPAVPLQHKYDVLDDILRTTSEGFLGMTMGCARCHDHKGDPFPQVDYYRFMSFFHGITQHDKKRVIETIGEVADKSAAIEIRNNRERKTAELIRRIGSMESKARNLFSKKHPDWKKDLEMPDGLRNPILISDSRTTPQNWYYTTRKPGGDWSKVSYRAETEKNWKEGSAPFGKGVPGSRENTQWNTRDIWLQKSFLLNSMPSGLKLSIYHNEEVEIFLNGQLIAEFHGYVTRYVNHTLKRKFINALQTGRNVLSVHCRNSEGSQLFDLALTATGPKPKLNISRLIRRQGTDIFSEQQVKEYRQWINQLKNLESAPPENLIQVMMVQESKGPVPDLHVHNRGNSLSKGDKVEPTIPQIFGAYQPAIEKPQNGRSTSGRRLALARWITNPDNPRSSRVMVNRIWQHHFGRGICPTSNDFGYFGERPTHPDLLDWLATEFVKNGWSIKQMHRLIMSSQAYQMSSTGQQEGLEKDPQNQLFWRFNMRRLTAEEIRDSILATSGNLRLKRNGPSMFPRLDDAVLKTSSTGAGKWGNSSPEEQARRSIYINIKRSLKPPELTSFDFADTDAPCPVRFSTTVPTQALNMINSRFLNDQAEILADRLRAEAGDELRKQIHLGFFLTVCRNPLDQEIDHCLELISDLKQDYQLEPAAALNRFCLLLLNLNEFIYLD